MGKKAIAPNDDDRMQDLLAARIRVRKLSRACDNSNKKQLPKSETANVGARDIFAFSPALICERRK